MTHSALTTRFAVTSDSSPRSGPVDSIGHHHAAGTSLEVALALFQPGGRTVSPNYCIRGRDIVLVVPEELRAWTSASSQDDGRSITYEIINSTGDPAWAFDPETIASVILLDADISRRYGIVPRHAIPGFWEHKNLYQWFGRSYATACAGPSFNIGYIIDSTLAALAGEVIPEGEDLMSLARIVARPSDGALFFMDSEGVDLVAGYVSPDMDNGTVVGSLNQAFGDYHTPESEWGFAVLSALMERRAAAIAKRRTEALAKAVDLDVDEEKLAAALAAAGLDVDFEVDPDAAQRIAEAVADENDARAKARLEQVADA